LIRAVTLALLASASGTFAAEPTSETDERLKKALQRFPKADLDGDGVLTRSEAREARERLRRAARPPDRNMRPKGGVSWQAG